MLIYGSPTVQFSNVIYMLVSIDDLGARRTVAFHAHKGWDDKTEKLIRSCI